MDTQINKIEQRKTKAIFSSQHRPVAVLQGLGEVCTYLQIIFQFGRAIYVWTATPTNFNL